MNRKSSLNAAVVDDYSATINTTGRVNVGGFASGTIETLNDNDWFQVTLQAGITYSIHLEGAETSKGSLLDPYFAGIYDSAGLFLGYANDDTATSLNPLVFFKPSSSGDYYLSATAFSAMLGSYQLSVALNAAPIFSAFNATVASGSEDKELPISFANLQAQANAVDSDGEIAGFVVKAVNSGTLKIGFSQATATAWNVASNNTLDSTHFAYWTPAFNANGAVNAFSVTAKDNAGLESSTTAVSVPVSVAAVPDVTLSAGTSPIEGGRLGEFSVHLDSPAPAGGLTINYLLNGTASLGFDYKISKGAQISALNANSFTIAQGQTSATLLLNAITDTIADNNESVNLNLLGSAGYQLIQNEFSFGSGLNIQTNANPQSLCTGDFNGDGKLDLAVTSSGVVSVLLRNAANTGFDAKIDYSTSVNAYAINAADFNGDGRLDLAIVNTDSNNVLIMLRNQTNNGFVSEATYATATRPVGLVSADFNNDGKLDLAVSNQTSGSISVLLRNAANNGFEPKVDYVSSANAQGISAGDVNGDGKTDLVATNRNDNTVSVWLRNATNSDFLPKVNYATGNQPASVNVADVNNDAKADLIVSNYADNSVSVLIAKNDNSGFHAKVDYETGLAPLLGASVADFNNDGYADIITANYASNTASVLLRNATNSGFDAKLDYETSNAPSNVSVGDFNGDGQIDFAVTNSARNSVSILNNTSRSSATLSIINNTAPPTGTNKSLNLLENQAYHFTANDFGYADTEGSALARITINSLPLAGALTLSGTSVQAGQSINAAQLAQLTFTPSTHTSGANYAQFSFTVNDGGLDSLSSNTISVNVAPSNDSFIDFNGDGQSDLTWQHSDGSFFVMLLNGSTFAGGSMVYQNLSSAWQLVNNRGDYNGDGKSDLLWWNTSSHSAYISQMNGGAIVSEGFVNYAQNLSAAWHLIDSSSDYNNDGKSDVLWWNTDNSGVYLALHNGAQSISESFLFEGVAGWEIKITGGDYDGDGNHDLLFWNAELSSAYMATLNGAQIKSEGFVVGNVAGWTIVDGRGDYNGDGKSDILWRNTGTGELWQYQMNGVQSVHNASVATVDNAWQIISAHNDFNGDGKADILWQNVDGSAGVSLLDGETMSAITNLGAYSGWTVQNADNDVNADGNADIVWTNTDGSAYVMEMDGVQIIAAAQLGPYDGWSLA